MTQHVLHTETHDMTDRLSGQEQLFSHRYGYVVQSHINHIGEVIMETNNHNRYVREILHQHLIPGGHCRISDVKDRKRIHHAYAICSIAGDEYNKLTVSVPPLKKDGPPEMYSIIDDQVNMLQSVLELLEKDIKIALHYMK